ncbi:MAG: pyridoxal-dependent decarboxylase [Bacteroidia bacterium]|nr:pyridoxal-dependent decarboxylase [Bacteroidia bacterium]
MLNSKSFREYAHKMVDWMADYLDEVEKYPVLSRNQPGDLLNSLPSFAPSESEPMDVILQDMEKLIMPGITHWQSPNFYAYFPANSSYASLLGEMITACLGVNGFSWVTSPAATELEERMMDWLGDMIGIPKSWDGVIQSTASEATFVAIVSAREQLSDFQINEKGFPSGKVYRVYGSAQLHSSIEKAVKIAGLGRENYVKVEVDEKFAMKKEALGKAIKDDIEQGYVPLCVINGMGTTSSTAMDDLEMCGEICKEFGIWLHVDAAYAGAALILPEYQYLMKGIEMADSFVFNPHKWLLTNFDCSVYFVKDKHSLIRTFQISPAYLKAANDDVVKNYRDWGLPLGRRFRALKLWFVLRNFGIKEMQKVLRKHMELTQVLLKKMEGHPQIEILAPVNLNLICFRYNPGYHTEEKLNQINEKLLTRINDTGNAFLIQTLLNEKYTIRIVLGHPKHEERHVEEVWQLISEAIKQIEA